MPCLEITMPRTDTDTRQQLATKLTETFAQNTRFEAEIFGVRFCEYDVGEAASGGKLWDGREGRPYLHFVLYCPRISRVVKQNVVKALTAVFTECLSKPDWLPIIHICEHPYDNLGVAGELASDAFEECANRNFYYELTDE
ncbi:MAG: hypothetical protein ABII79_09930 [bacterium]